MGAIYTSPSHMTSPTAVGVHCQLLPTLANSCQLLPILPTPANSCQLLPTPANYCQLLVITWHYAGTLHVPTNDGWQVRWFGQVYIAPVAPVANTSCFTRKTTSHLAHTSNLGKVGSAPYTYGGYCQNHGSIYDHSWISMFYFIIALRPSFANDYLYNYIFLIEIFDTSSLSKLICLFSVIQDPKINVTELPSNCSAFLRHQDCYLETFSTITLLFGTYVIMIMRSAMTNGLVLIATRLLTPGSELYGHFDINTSGDDLFACRVNMSMQVAGGPRAASAIIG